MGGSVDCAQENGNYWCFYIQLPDGAKFVRIDITPSVTVPSTTIEGGSKADMIISSLTYPTSKDSQIISKLQVRENLLVKDVVDTLIDEGAHRYEFNGGNTACRAWVSRQMNLLLSRRIIISNEEVTVAKEALITQAPKGYTYKMDHGEYY